MDSVSRIFLTVVAFPWRCPLGFWAAGSAAGAAWAIEALRGVRWAETAGLLMLGGAIGALATALWLAAAIGARDRMVQDDLRREMARARAAEEERFQRDFVEFLEQCVREEGDTPVWEGDNAPEEP